MNRIAALALIGALINPLAGAHTIDLAAGNTGVTRLPVAAQTATTAPAHHIGKTHRHAAIETRIARRRAQADTLRANLRAYAAAQVKALRAHRDATLKAINPAAFARITQHRARIKAQRTAMTQQAGARRQFIALRQSDPRPAPADYAASAPRPRWQRRTDW